jgi:hypothetical protein
MRQRLAELGELLLKHGEFFRFGDPVCDDVESVLEMLSVVAGGLQHLLGKHSGRLDEGRVIQRHQRVQGGVRARGFDGADLASAVIKEHRGADDATPKHIERAAVKSISVVLHIGLLAKGGLLPDALGLVRLYRRPAKLRIQKTRQCQCLIPQHPRRHSEARPTCEQAVVRVRL